ncbi:amylo-alpha-1,6-glucosidase [Acidisoma cellulosilytica]|uniref:Amylo-alpha-1,6-glucosidase n=1 Tax=Acidisoma cellulosilyticum TaxID=2802395 RepID=A0A963Z5K6_9PROT|nr:amylo-alpha-1,6-glucosidase [Acidisoma cellulosilyticum]MCB8883237.1 amylo-alpha-1,6-glucosidase [Acidisoma cellulosilyticum]
MSAVLPKADQVEPPYAVGATLSLQERQYRTLKNGDMFGIFDLSGNILPYDGGTEGLYNRDTRHLSVFDLTIGGGRPVLLSSTLREDNTALICDLANPDLTRDGTVVLDHSMVHVRRVRFMINATLFERIQIRSFAHEPQLIRLEFTFDSDFADLFEVRGTPRVRRGTRQAPDVDEASVTLGYVGLDEKRRTTRLRFSPQPTTLDGGRASFDVEVQPGQQTLLYVEIDCNDQPVVAARDVRANYLISFVEVRRWMRTRSARAAAMESSNELFNEAIRRAISDLYMLITEKPTGLYPYAGIPWFTAVFGRDALITAYQALWLDPAIARGVLKFLAEVQATETDAAADSEPGKIVHEMRNGEMAELGEVPFRRYYGSVDSTPLFVMLAGAYFERTHDGHMLQQLWPHLEAAMEWIAKYGDRDGDGFVEYYRATGSGLQNQGWKDSFDSVFHADGSLAEGPIALCEVQGYVYAAHRAMAEIGRRLGHEQVATFHDKQAETLRAAFEEAFWCEEIGTYAIALDGAKKPCRIRTSNPGHLMMTGMILPERAARMAEGFMSHDFFSGWGIRTVASTEARYNPMGYHNGSVWPHDNALIAMGLARYGHTDAVAKIFEGQFDAALYIDMRRLPELFCGFARRRNQGPTFYPVACSPQAWAAAALPALLQASLGLSIDPAARSVIFSTPKLPSFLDEMILHNIRIGEARVTVRIQRMGDEVAINVRERQGDIHVVVKS